MYLLVGLGNPGDKYRNHRHNVGFQLIDYIAGDYQAAGFSAKHQSLTTKAMVAEHECLLCKPQQFMNRSGAPVGEVMRYFRLSPEQVIVFYDELDLPVGKMRIKQNGGAGGHNGIKDIDRVIGKDYWRVRIGIDHPGHKDRVSGYVLSDFNQEEKQTIERMHQTISRELPVLLSQGHEAMMSKVALAMSA